MVLKGDNIGGKYRAVRNICYTRYIIQDFFWRMQGDSGVIIYLNKGSEIKLKQ